MSASNSKLLVRPRLGPQASGVVNRVAPADAGWDLLGAEIRRMAKGEVWNHEVRGCEVAIVILGGQCSVTSNRGTWKAIGGRADVFDGMPVELEEHHLGDGEEMWIKFGVRGGGFLLREASFGALPGE